MKRMVGLGLMKILVHQMYIDLRDLVETTWIKINTLQVQFLMSFLKIECGQY